MRKLIIILFLVINTQILFAQAEKMFYQGQFQITIAFSLLPVNKTNSEIDFKYIDGNKNSKYTVDTISVNYKLKKKYFENAVSIGIGYFIADGFRIAVNTKPYINSFLSNKAKNGEVYGVEFEWGLDYFNTLSNDVSISYGITAARIIGGFGITSNGAKNKDHLVVNGNELYDDEIGFHIIDNSWGISPELGLHYKANNNVIISSTYGYKKNFARTSRMNFAGFEKDGTVKWNRKDYNDSDLNLIIDKRKITESNINDLPYKFSGSYFEFGTSINIK